VAALEEAERLLRAAQLSDNEPDGWSAEFAEMLADGMAACRWFVRMGFKPPGSFGYWLFRITEGQIWTLSSHRDLDAAVDRASSAVSELEREWDRQWAERTGGSGAVSA
jgi:hypothetical protein